MFYININQLANFYCEKVGWLLHQRKNSVKGLHAEAISVLFNLLNVTISITSSVTP